jgi:uncharacterized C2H2 Zn-finger protein
MFMEDDGYPISIEEAWDRLIQMEGEHVFRCANCPEVFETVLEWAQHTVSEHGEAIPEVTAVAKQ